MSLLEEKVYFVRSLTWESRLATVCDLNNKSPLMTLLSSYWPTLSPHSSYWPLSPSRNSVSEVQSVCDHLAVYPITIWFMVRDKSTNQTLTSFRPTKSHVNNKAKLIPCLIWCLMKDKNIQNIIKDVIKAGNTDVFFCFPYPQKWICICNVDLSMILRHSQAYFQVLKLS